MGLDMYAMVTKEVLDGDVDFKAEEAREIFYWRKHPNLHGWMEQLYYDKGGTASSFNCVCVALHADDLDRLEQAVKAQGLPGTSGFFFGASDGTETEGDLEFVRMARDAIADGYTVFYDSWW